MATWDSLLLRKCLTCSSVQSFSTCSAQNMITPNLKLILRNCNFPPTICFPPNPDSSYLNLFRSKSRRSRLCWKMQFPKRSSICGSFLTSVVLLAFRESRLSNTSPPFNMRLETSFFKLNRVSWELSFSISSCRCWQSISIGSVFRIFSHSWLQDPLQIIPINCL